MKELVLKLKNNNPAVMAAVDGEIPVEAENIIPRQIKNKNLQEIGEIPLVCGNKEYQIKDFFEIEGEPSQNILLVGNFNNFKYIGKGMSSGSIIVDGEAGMHTGAEMEAGAIYVREDAGDWLGAEMTGGLIRVAGNAGNYIGAAYRGDKLGMNRGVIIVEGDSGNFTGNQMRRGEIIVMGDTGDMPGAQMIAGSIYILGEPGLRPGAGMKRGTIVAMSPVEIMPTFHYNLKLSPRFLKIAFKFLEQRFDIEIPPEQLQGTYKRYVGDHTEIGKGEIFIWQP